MVLSRWTGLDTSDTVNVSGRWGRAGGRGCMEAGQEVIWGSDPQMEIKHRSSFIDPNAGKLNRSSKPTKHHNELTFFQLQPWSSLGEALKHLVRVQKRSWLGLKYLKTQLETSRPPVKDIWLLYYKHGWKRPDFWSEIFSFFCQRYLVFSCHKTLREMSWFLVSAVLTSRQNISVFVLSNTARDVRSSCEIIQFLSPQTRLEVSWLLIISICLLQPHLKYRVKHDFMFLYR